MNFNLIKSERAFSISNENVNVLLKKIDFYNLQHMKKRGLAGGSNQYTECVYLCDCVCV